MSDNRTTKAITYNLAERGRKHNGQDRNDVDIRSVINAINSEQVQELVQSGDLMGYYGHEIRQRFGMNPPDTWVNPKGETVIITPAIRTISLNADNNGNVTAKHEFLDTDSGNYALRLYKANTGGFSSVIPRTRKANLYHATGFAGYDYVLQPNYATNKGNAQLDSIINGIYLDDMQFDSLNACQRTMINQVLENAIACQLDNISTNLQAIDLINHYQQETIHAQNKAIETEQYYQQKRLEYKKRKQQQKEQYYDSLLAESIPFNEISEQWDSFLTVDTDSTLQQNKQKITHDRVSIFEQLRGKL